MPPTRESIWLAGLDDDYIVELIRNRPDLAGAVSMTHLGELLAAPEGAMVATISLDRDCLAVSQILQVEGGHTTLDRIRELIGGDPEPAIERLARSGLAHRDGEMINAVVTGIWEHPFGLGRSVRELAGTVNIDTLRKMAQGLGLSPKPTKVDLTQQLERVDPEVVRERAASVPEGPARDLLHTMTWQDPVDFGGGMAAELLASMGLIMLTHWAGAAIPREFALALRGNERLAELDGPPAIESVEIPDTHDAVPTALNAVNVVSSLLDLSGTEPIKMLKSGGIGKKEIKRLAKAVQVPVDEMPLWIDVAFAGNLLDRSEWGYVPTSRFDAWRSGSYGERWSLIARAWHRMAHAATHRFAGCCEAHATDAVAPPLPVESPAGQLRRGILEALEELPEGRGILGISGVEAYVAWRKPYFDQDGRLLDAALREAELLGVVSGGALTSMGRALAGREGVTAAAAAVLPEPEATAVLQADLTAIAAGAPSPGLAEVLDACADLEARGAAWVWRFSEESVRRALDAGGSHEQVIADLERIAEKGVPQPLRYLVGDVARKHGNVRVAGIASCVIVEDEALLAEIVASRTLRALGLRMVAPTVAVAPAEPERVMKGLRDQGYGPVGEAADGAVIIQKEPALRSDADGGLPVDEIDYRDAVRLIRQGRSEPEDRTGPAEKIEKAVQVRADVLITRFHANLDQSDHWLTDIDLINNRLTGWCRFCDRNHRIKIGDIAAVHNM